MTQSAEVIWKFSLAWPASGLLFDQWDNLLDLEAEGLPADLVRQIESLRADTRAFWRGAVDRLAKNPRQPPEVIIAEAGAATIHEAAEALLVALSLARPEVMVDVDLQLMP